jgi:carbon storage regulator
MLVLDRYEKQSIVIKDDIVVTVLNARGRKVRLGIEAPKDVPVHRTEVHKRIRGELRAR